uniref:Uncharacterized protein n=1 Tax=Periophthalmus magnuspinnatus TaxID=409849 RepID=A0A3B4ANI5_9GOBI
QPAQAQLCVSALCAARDTPPAQHVLFDELVTRTAVQAQLQPAVVLRKVQKVLRHANGEGQIAAHASDNDGSAHVSGLDFHLAPHTRAWQVFSGGLVNLLICAAQVGFKDHCDLKSAQACLRFNTLSLIDLKELQDKRNAGGWRGTVE